MVKKTLHTLAFVKIERPRYIHRETLVSKLLVLSEQYAPLYLWSCKGTPRETSSRTPWYPFIPLSLDVRNNTHRAKTLGNFPDLAEPLWPYKKFSTNAVTSETIFLSAQKIATSSYPLIVKHELGFGGKKDVRACFLLRVYPKTEDCHSFALRAQSCSCHSEIWNAFARCTRNFFSRLVLTIYNCSYWKFFVGDYRGVSPVPEGCVQNVFSVITKHFNNLPHPLARTTAAKHVTRTQQVNVSVGTL